MAKAERGEMSNDKTIDDGGPAYPYREADRFIADSMETHLIEGSAGMSLRDWLAGQALVGLLGSGIAHELHQQCSEVAQMAYENADAMLAARKAKS